MLPYRLVSAAPSSTVCSQLSADSTLDCATSTSSSAELDDAYVKGVDQVAENLTKRVHAPLLAGGDRRVGCGRAPHLRDVACHLTRAEAVEERIDDLRGHRAAERGCAAGEVGVPEVGEPQGEHRLVGFVRRVGDDPDRLDELEAGQAEQGYEDLKDATASLVDAVIVNGVYEIVEARVVE